MIEVSKAAFYADIYARKLDVHPSIVSAFPYTSEWRFPRIFGSPIYGKTVDRVEGGQIKTSYFIMQKAVAKVEGGK